MPALFQRRTVLLPTLWGWLCILLIVGTLSALLIHQLGFLLAKNDPVEADYLVVEGWLTEQELLSALALFQQGQYQSLLTTGGPITNQVQPQFASYADKAAHFLRQHGMPANQLHAIAAPASAQNRTFLSAVELRRWLQQQQLNPATMNIVTSGVHSRRTQTLFNLAFHDQVQFGIISLSPIRYSLNRWWQSSDGIKSVVVEVIGNLYTACCFDPGEKDSHQERWGIPASDLSPQ